MEEAVFKPFVAASPPPTTHTEPNSHHNIVQLHLPVAVPAKAAEGADQTRYQSPPADSTFQLAMQRLIAMQNDCINMMKQQIIGSMVSGSAFRPYNSQRYPL